MSSIQLQEILVWDVGGNQTNHLDSEQQSDCAYGAHGAHSAHNAHNAHDPKTAPQSCQPCLVPFVPFTSHLVSVAAETKAVHTGLHGVLMVFNLATYFIPKYLLT